MASKIEISEVEKLIEEHREVNPLFANGLITALNVLLDDPVSLIEIKTDGSDIKLSPGEITHVGDKPDDMTGCFSWALSQAENNGKKVSRKSDSENTLSFENNVYIVTSDLRGREALTDFTMDMIKSNDWQIVK